MAKAKKMSRLQHLLVEAGVSQHVLRVSTEPVPYWLLEAARTVASSAQDYDRGQSVRVLGEHTDEFVLGNEKPDQTLFPRAGWGQHRQILGGQAVLVWRVVNYDTASPKQYRDVVCLIVRPQADEQAVLDWATRELLGDGADGAYVTALHNRQCAIEWIKTRFDPKPGPPDNSLQLNDNTVWNLGPNALNKGGVLIRLLGRHGPTILEPFYGPEQMAWQAAREEWETGDL